MAVHTPAPAPPVAAFTSRDEIKGPPPMMFVRASETQLYQPPGIAAAPPRAQALPTASSLAAAAGAPPRAPALPTASSVAAAAPAPAPLSELEQIEANARDFEAKLFAEANVLTEADRAEIAAFLRGNRGS